MWLRKRACCNLSDPRWRRIEVSNRMMTDRVEALGATPRSLPWVHTVPQVGADAIDGATTGAQSVNANGLHPVSRHQHILTATRGPAPAVWPEAQRETGEGLACNTGIGPCRSGHRGRMLDAVQQRRTEQAARTADAQHLATLTAALRRGLRRDPERHPGPDVRGEGQALMLIGAP